MQPELEQLLENLTFTMNPGFRAGRNRRGQVHYSCTVQEASERPGTDVAMWLAIKMTGADRMADLVPAPGSRCFVAKARGR